MYRPLNIIFVVVAFAILASCGGGNAVSVSAEGEEVELVYADLLSMRQCAGYVYAEVRNPWDSGAVLHSYVLVERDRPLPAGLPKGDVVRIPLRRSVVYTLVHMGLIEELGAYDQVAGVCDLRYMDIPRVQADVRAGRLRDLGEGLNPNIEGFIDMEPDAVLLSPFQNDGGYGRLGKLGIPIVECADYMETSALGRAEWMKFYGLLYGKETEADSLFRGIVCRYEALKQLAAGQKERPTVVTDLKYGAMWYVPAGGSTTGGLLSDAGADYVFKDWTGSGNLTLAPETVFDQAADAQFWLIRYNQRTSKTYDELAQEYTNYRKMAAFRNRNIYACNTEDIPFYKEAPFHPDLLLRDFIKIFHPEVLRGDSLRYYKKME
ncbi:MAG: ABC transporter substrate-binding protein [Bacteroidaceae bacterium]|nr:ABC transporter substrate-binding protein [Bacteroidaceae bacterium]